MKTANKTILTSILVIALCLSLITGATFALFSDDSEVNIAVNAGDVEVVAKASINGAWSAKWDDDTSGYKPNTDLTIITSEDHQTFEFTNGGTASVDDGVVKLNKITPGDGVQILVEIENRSTVNIQYRVTVAPNENNKELFPALEVKLTSDEARENEYPSIWTFVDAEENDIDPVYVNIEFPWTTDNEYNGMSCELFVVVEAYQGNVHLENTVAVDSEEALRQAATEKNVNIILSQDIDLQNGTLTFTGNGTLDTNGYSVTNTADVATVSVAKGAVVTFADSTGTITNVAKARPAVLVEAGGKAIIEGGSFTRDNSDGGNHYVIENYGTMVINDGTFYHKGGKLGGTITLVANKTGGTMTINGGTFGGMNIAVKNEDADLTINGGTFDAIGNTEGDNLAQSLQNQGNATITGGTFNNMVANIAQLGYDNVTEYIGNLTITGGTFNERVRSQKIADEEKDENGKTIIHLPTGTPIVTINDGAFNKDIESGNGAQVNIEGGNFHANMVASRTSNNIPVIGKIAISGGNFDTMPSSSCLADGYVTDVHDDGTFGVIEGEIVVKYDINNPIGFGSLAAAVRYGVLYGNTTSFTLDLQTDLTESLVVPKGYTITLKLNNHTLTNTEGEHTITVYGTLKSGTATQAIYGGKIVNVSKGKAALYIAEGGKSTAAYYFSYARDGRESGNYYVIENHGELTLPSSMNATTYVTHTNTSEIGVTALIANKSGGILTISSAAKMMYTGMPVVVENEAGATLKITNVTLTGNIVNAGTTTISGGTINGNIITEAGGATTISKGTINGDIINNGGQISITGGTFANDPTKFLTEGYTATLGDDGKWTVSKAA